MEETKNLVKQRKFLDEYVKTLDLKASAIAAGYKKQTAVAIAKKLLKNPRVLRDLRLAYEEKAAHLEVSKAYIIANYLKILDWAVSKNENGDITDPQIALRTLDSLVKNAGGNFTSEAEAEEKNLTGIDRIFSKIKGLDPTKI